MSLISIISRLANGTGSAAPADSQNLLIVFSGESNSGGQARNVDAAGGELGARANTLILNNSTLEFETLNIGVNNLLGHFNFTPTQQGELHSWELGLANLRDAGTLRTPLRLVKTGQGGSVIANWDVGANYSGVVEPWTKFQERVDAALAILNPTGTKFGLLYHQGINDIIAGTAVATWKTKTKDHFTKIRAKYGTVPIVMGKIQSTAGAAYSNYNTAIEEIATEMSEVYWVAVEDLPKDDIYHFSYAGQKTLGARLIQKLLDNGYTV